MFGKIVNGEFVTAPDRLIDEDGYELYLPTDATYLAFGYLPVVESEGVGIAKYSEIDGKIVQDWVEAPLTLEERATELENENKRLTAQLTIQAEQLAMLEDCLLELGDEIYA